MTNDDRRVADDALHAAACWLQRLGARDDAAAVVTIAPAAAVGVWVAGAGTVGMLPGVDDAGAELCEALAPFVHRALAHLERDATVGALAMCRPGAGARLQAVVVPSRQKIALRVVGGGGVVVLAALHLLDEVH